MGDALATLAGLREGGEVGALEEAIRYVEGQRGWLGDYGAWRESGLPVGSGLVEREVELLVNRRQKRRGMRWRRDNAGAVLALRVRRLNEDWDARHPPGQIAA